MHKILIVEDEQLLREAYERILSTEPYMVETATNGQEALDRCAKTDYDLVLLDLMMPVTDGVGFLQGMHARDDRSMPSRVVILSNLSSGEELSKAMSLGAHRSVLKAELSPQELIATVRHEVEAEIGAQVRA